MDTFKKTLHIGEDVVAAAAGIAPKLKLTPTLSPENEHHRALQRKAEIAPRLCRSLFVVVPVARPSYVNPKRKARKAVSKADRKRLIKAKNERRANAPAAQ